MELEYAFAKLQSLIAEEVFIRNIPVKIGRNTGNTQEKEEFPTNIGITKCNEISTDHSLLFYNLNKKKFGIIAFQKMFVDHQECKILDNFKKVYEEARISTSLNVFDQYEDYTYYLSNFSKLYYYCSKCDIPHIFYFVLPDKEAQKSDTLYMKPSALLSISQNMSNPRNKIHDKVLYSQWSNEDREQLKRVILYYGYGRWKQVQKQNLVQGGKLCDKNKPEIRAFANSFIRSLAEDTGNDQMDLKQFLYSILEEYPDDPYIQPNSKDWDIQNLKQRAVPYTKRLQLLYRIKVLIKRFKEDQLKNIQDKEKINWENLLNFLPNSALYGQRPSVWWTKKHDTDLLRGVYKYGYANYQTIRLSPDYCFQELEKTNAYSNFPSSDALTRRLKKLISTIIKSEEDKGKIDFDMSASSEDEEKGWTGQEKEHLFNYLKDYGVPLNLEGRSNWLEIREQMKSSNKCENFDKSISQIEKMVQKMRLQCQELIVQHDSFGGQQQSDILDQDQLQIKTENQNQLLQEEENAVFKQKDEQQSNIIQKKQDNLINQNNQDQPQSQSQQLQQNDNKEDIENQKNPLQQNLNQDQQQIQIQQSEFIITYQEAMKFNRNTNMLHFIRKTVLANNSQIFNQFIEEFIKHSDQLQKDHIAYINPQIYPAGALDLNLLNLVSTHGFCSLENLNEFQQFNLHEKGLGSTQLIERLNWISNTFKEYKDRSAPKKRKAEKDISKDPNKKKIKIEVNRDEFGNIIYPIQVSTSLKILNLGEINYKQLSYHSEQNLFPVGFTSLRTHSSMIHKGGKCDYICEILEGDGKPLFRVTSEEDKDHPIVRDSCSGCWLYVCERVNQLQDTKKEKVTVSGPDRFGLSQSQVIELLEELPNVDKCHKYKFKSKEIKRENELNDDLE